VNPLVWLGVALVGTVVVSVGSGRLESAADDLAVHYGLPGVVQGALVAAVGSSMPEFASAVLATLLHGDFELGIGAIVGSAVFNVLVIPALSALVSPGVMDADRDLVFKEALFYMLAVAVVTLTFALAVIYEPAAEGDLQGVVTRPLALVPVGLYGLYVFVQFAEAAEYDATAGRSVALGRAWATMAASLVVIVVGVEALVRAAIALGEAFGTPSFLWGLTVVAAGTSLPDAVVSVLAAREGKPSVSLANVVGSNVFDLLVAVPAGVLLAGATVVDFAAAVPMLAFLVVATVVFFAAMRTDFELTTAEAVTMLVLYAGFVAWLLAESVGVTSVI
jgi:cation:H+ antiporter